MIGVNFDPDMVTDPEWKHWWKTWRERSERATRRAIRAFETWFETKDPRPVLDLRLPPEVWSSLKQWFLANIFHGKCAYCERRLSGTSGDAEHFRPKGKVERWDADRREQVKCEITHPGTGVKVIIPHPGYFWLAYDWRNLVPACEFCNSGSGKGAQFYIDDCHIVLTRLTKKELATLPQQPRESEKWPSYYYLTPALLDEREKPLLLNPLNPRSDRDPRKHIAFGVRGIEAAIDNSRIGLTTIKTFRLFTEDVRLARQEAQENFRDKYYDSLRKERNEEETKQILKEYREGRKAFSAAALDYHKIIVDKQQSL